MQLCTLVKLEISCQSVRGQIGRREKIEVCGLRLADDEPVKPDQPCLRLVRIYGVYVYIRIRVSHCMSMYIRI